MSVVDPRSDRPFGSQRNGIVLVVVIALLALFAAVALSFVFYAESAATAANYCARAQTQLVVDIEPELLLSYFLGQLIYDTDNEHSVLRGHSLARTMYGYNPAGGNNVSFCGNGKLRYPVAPGGPDNFFALNYQYHEADGFFRDPELYGSRSVKSDPKGPYVAEGGIPFTYPDVNNAFVAAVNANGEVLIQSYYRPWAMEPTPNFDATNPQNEKWLKYLQLHPHTKYHIQFTTPDADAGGHVKNLDWARGVLLDVKLDPVTKQFTRTYSMNDSFWLDAGFPVMTAADGRKYKPLFAPLVLPLDSRVNLWIHGGWRDNAPMAGNQGWGRGEVNPIYALSDPGEFKNLFLGNSGVPGRYGSNGKPEGSRAAVVSTNPWYARHDFDGKAAGPLALPAAGSLLAFPTYPGGWDSSSPPELLDHWFNYNYSNPAAGDGRRPALSNSEAALRLHGKGSTGFTSDLFKLLPNNMASARTRGLTTLLSFDLNRPGFVPFYSHDTTKDSPYQYDARGWPILVNPPPYPPLPPQNYPNSEFTAEWRSKLGNIPRVNLHRNLTDYPAPDPATGMIDLTILANQTAYNQAVADRQAFAKELYLAMVAMTGAMEPNQFPGAMPKTDPKFQAARWLAQLAVNIVDFIDNDDYLTPFRWYVVVDPATKLPVIPAVEETLVGTELPRLLLNEGYAQFDNDAMDPGIAAGTATYYKLNCWAELHNAFKETPAGEAYPRDGGSARLKIGANNGYRLIVSRPNQKLHDIDNLYGDPDPGNQLTMVDDWGTQLVEQTVLPGNGAYGGTTSKNEGFYVLGPRANKEGDPLFLPGRDPGLPVTYATPQMSAKMTLTDPMPTILTYMLQRLANPHLPPNMTPADPTDPTQQRPNPLYNPYITVDVMGGVPVYKGLVYEPALAAMPPEPPSMWSTKGRNQPYAGVMNLMREQKPASKGATQPHHTFFRHNAVEDAQAPYPDMTTKPSAATPNQTLKIPFDWLLHLDRKPVSPIDLYHVSGYRPHELTQWFTNGVDVARHTYFWGDASALLWRIFEITYTPDLVGGAVEGGRTPGKINLNMLWDYEPFLALCDPQPGNSFDAATVKSIYDQLVSARTKNAFSDGTRMPGRDDFPYWPWGVGLHPTCQQYPGSLGEGHTLLRPGGPNNRILFLPGNHPYKKYELLTKTFNNLTLRSNCFAAWVTVGFFEIVDETARPPKLGAEIGRAENRHIRHRFFALIDRSNLASNPGPQPTFNSRNDTQVVPYYNVID